ncbi:MAG: DUF3365 domain-containing protein [Coleofasciculus sp. S288]|nr:DUF3365 domain-containing protein [Coleofasciculus sp. S288]
MNNLKLGTKFTLFLSLVFISGIFISGVALSEALQRKAQEQIVSKGMVLLETMNSVRNYTNTQVNPLLTPLLDREEEFIAESIPSYSVREIFEKLRQNPDYNNFFHKDATLNPTNLRDKADEFETQLAKRFRQDSNLKELSGFRELFGEKVFYIARPLAIKEESCLRCHSTPDAAPKSQINTYGSEHGFGWKLNEIIGAQTIYVPAESVLESARRSFSLVIGIFLGVFAAIILLINFLLKQSVIQPIRIMARMAEKISENTADSDKAQECNPQNLTKVARRGDELGQMGRVFQRMAQEVRDREQRLKQQVRELRIEIDHAKKQKQVAEITDTDFFQQLEKRAKKLRTRNSED